MPKKYVNGSYLEMTPEELERNSAPAESTPTAEERIAALEVQNEMLTECLLEISGILYA